MGSGCGQGGNGGNGGANLAYTRFLFVIARTEDDAHGTRLRTAGAHIARGFFNDFDIDDSRESQVQAFETIQFLVREGETRPLPETTPPPHINMARYAVQITSKYRPRLQEIDDEFRRRLGEETAEIISLEGAARNPRYSSAEMVNYSNRGAPLRRSGRVSRNAIIIPIRKTAEWWQKSVARAAFIFLSARRSRERQPGERACHRRGERHRLAVPPRVSQPGWLRAGQRVRLRHLLRV